MRTATRRDASDASAKTTRPVWGIVAMVSLVAATTLEGSLAVTAISVALFTFGAWKGGYMKGGEA